MNLVISSIIFPLVINVISLFIEYRWFNDSKFSQRQEPIYTRMVMGIILGTTIFLTLFNASFYFHNLYASANLSLNSEGIILSIALSLAIFIFPPLLISIGVTSNSPGRGYRLLYTTIVALIVWPYLVFLTGSYPLAGLIEEWLPGYRHAALRTFAYRYSENNNLILISTSAIALFYILVLSPILAFISDPVKRFDELDSKYITWVVGIACTAFIFNRLFWYISPVRLDELGIYFIGILICIFLVIEINKALVRRERNNVDLRQDLR